MAAQKRPTTSALEIVRRRYIDGRPGAEAALEQATLNALIAQAIYDLRLHAGLTQKQLAARVGTSHSVISRLEHSDYDGHSLRMLQRVCLAMDHRVQIRLVPLPRARRASA